MIKTTYQTPELRDANDNVVQEGAFGKNTALANSTNDGWIDYVMNDLEALHDTIGDSAPTLDGNGHVVEPANLAIGDEDGVRLKTGYLKTSGGTVSGTLNVAQNLKMQDNQENVFGGFYVPASSATSQYLQVYGGQSAANTDVGSSLLLFPSGDGHFTLRARSSDNSAVYDLVGNNNGTLTWRGQELAVRNSPSFTGNPTAPTQETNNNSTRIATTEYVVSDLKANTPLMSDVLAEVIPNGADLNDYTTPGTYRTTGASVTASLLNCPDISFAIKLIVIYVGYGSFGYGMQILLSGNKHFHVRSKTTNGWTNWGQVGYTDEVLPLTGGTMTGLLTVTGNSISIRSADLVKGTPPSSDTSTPNYYICDKNGAALVAMYSTLRPSGDNVFYTLVSKNLSAYSAIGYRFSLSNSSSVSGYFSATRDGNIDLGSASLRWKQLYAATTTISTSDERMKDNIVAIPDEVIDAWGEVGWYQYQFKDSIAEKGETKARIHTGAIAQRIESVFTAHGLDANKYGLLCYDEWKSEPAERDEDGNIVQEARPAGNRYSLRYEEALCMEAAYQRRRADRLEQRLEAIEQRLSALETL